MNDKADVINASQKMKQGFEVMLNNEKAGSNNGIPVFWKDMPGATVGEATMASMYALYKKGRLSVSGGAGKGVFYMAGEGDLMRPIYRLINPFFEVLLLVAIYFGAGRMLNAESTTVDVAALALTSVGLSIYALRFLRLMEYGPLIGNTPVFGFPNKHLAFSMTKGANLFGVAMMGVLCVLNYYRVFGEMSNVVNVHEASQAYYQEFFASLGLWGYTKILVNTVLYYVVGGSIFVMLLGLPLTGSLSNSKNALENAGVLSIYKREVPGVDSDVGVNVVAKAGLISIGFAIYMAVNQFYGFWN